MRIAFLGNHTVGVRTVSALAEQGEIAAVVAHPPDPEDGVRYESVHDLALARGWPVIRARGRDPRVLDFLAAARPDLTVIADYRYLLPVEAIGIARLGTVNLHPSLLPRFRGRAPVNWAILHGERELGLTAHFVEEGMDTGDVIARRAFRLGEDEDVGDALERLYPLYEELGRELVERFAAGPVVAEPQDHSAATAFPARTPADGRIDWSQPAVRVRDLVRAVARPYPGAFSGAHVVWRARLASGEWPAGAPGTVVGFAAGGPVVRCGRDCVELLDVEGPALALGTVLGDG